MASGLLAEPAHREGTVLADFGQPTLGVARGWKATASGSVVQFALFGVSWLTWRELQKNSLGAGSMQRMVCSVRAWRERQWIGYCGH